MWQLWENTDVFHAFIDDFVIGQSSTFYLSNQSYQADKILYMTANNMFIDPTS